MKSAEPLMSEQQASPHPRVSSVRLGRPDYVSVIVRLTSMELYKIRRRAMSKVLSLLGILATIGLFALFALIVLLMSRSGASADAINNFSEALRLPGSLTWTGQLLSTLGQVLIIILVSTIVGGEYTAGTVRLMLTRGPTRTQIFFSKVGVALVCIVLGVVGITLLGIISGFLFNLTTSITATFDFFSMAWLGHAVLYLLAIMLGLFVYAMMALCLSTLGRATAAGLAGVLTWSFLIEPLIETISYFGRGISGPVGSFFQSLPDYLIGTNIGVLVGNQEQYLISANAGLQAGGPSNLQALLVLVVYIVVFVGSAWWVTIRRDVTN
ncbi:MAG: ABC transporter permease [Acidobacteriia bacterium]|nr:ABC transporter permease [Terriglobia bacterium]